ncbi:uncharacterized protein EAF02_003172 [Botrytis sinoallii]|uniref:uncharacterized protein n=1 Tax=Botrytis sinoallii TaxID=1463999 RepID=UPI0019020EED|nr:uncharacterized protein EAF02_003172 [Botrytis sinoallii]KAF7888631.1 hypothetical protein EAF02_003172 [Botrytis sinoallii]
MSSPFKNSPIRLKSPRDNLGSSIMESAYRTQQDLMAKKARENGIPTSEITKQFQATLSQIYQQNPQCTEDWALGKAEYHVWTQFFPNDPWPGILPKTSQLSFSDETMRSESGEITSSPEKGSLSFPSRPKPNFSTKIEDVLLNAAGNSNVLAVYREALVNMKERYPRESLEWQQWMAGSKVWVSNFRQRGTFPCNEPPRSYILRSSDTNHLNTVRSRRGGEDKSRSGRSGSSWQAEEATSRRRSRSPPIEPMGRDRYRQNRSEGTTRQGRTIKSEESPRNFKAMRVGETEKDSGNVVRAREDGPLTYGPKENEMQKKAYNMGGIEFRHAFFRALQTSRDFVRARHPNCDRSQKHWLADRMAWETVFKNEPFPWLNDKPPGVPSLASLPPIHKTSREVTGNYSMAPPPAQKVSSGANTSHRSVYSMTGSKSKQSRPSSAYSANVPVGTAVSGGTTPFGSSPEMPRKLSAALLNKGVMNTIGEESSEDNGMDLAEGKREVIIRKNTLFRALLGDWDDSFKSVQRGLGVTIEYHEDASGHFKLTIEPYQPGDNVALERAYKFLEIWKRLIYSDQLIKLEHFWAQYKNHDKTTAVNRKPMIHVNGKKILCQGKFGDLCDFFSQEIQKYQSNMAEYADTENALACSTLFEVRPYDIYLSSYPLPILLDVDTKARNKMLDDHDAFLEDWVRSSFQNRISLSDMSHEYARRSDQKRMELDMDLDELLKEGAKAANQMS